MPTRQHLRFSSPASTWRATWVTRGSATSSACAGSKRCISAAASRRPSALAEALLERTELPLDKAAVLEQLILAHTTQLRYRKALDTAVRALELLGEHVPGRPGTAQVMAELARTKLALAGRRMDRPACAAAHGR